jgi:hypothetical protein
VRGRRLDARWPAVTDESAPTMEGQLRVEAVFQGVDERHAHTIATELIDRAHELANLPDCQCDVDVSVEGTSADSHVDPAAQPARARPVTR